MAIIQCVVQTLVRYITYGALWTHTFVTTGCVLTLGGCWTVGCTFQTLIVVNTQDTGELTATVPRLAPERERESIDNEGV